MRILVTGAKGFIGTHLCRLLRKKGHEVREFDTKTGDNVLNVTSLKNAMSGMDQVYHLAGVVGVQKTMDLPMKTFIVNAIGSLNVASVARDKGIKMFLASSSEVYGQGDRAVSLHEEMEIRCDISKRWIYAMSKIAAEMMVMSTLSPEQYVIGRFFNVVGPGQRPRTGMVLPRFIDQAIRGELITVYGNGLQERTFGHAGQIVKATVELMENHHGIFNIAGSESCTIRELAELVKDIMASDSQIVYRPGPADAHRRLADTRRLRNTLGWVPDMSLGKIIQLTGGWWLTCMEQRS